LCLNQAQQLYLEKNPKLQTFRGNREIILKARQMGFTTLIAAKMFLDTVNIPNTESIMVAQDETNAKKLFNLIKRFNENLPPELKRKVGTDSVTKLEFSEINSVFTVGWAGSAKLGRGGTLNNVHFSEAAFYTDAGPLISGLLESVPLDGNVFMESTANGVGNYFCQEYRDAEEGNSIYKARFFPWYIDPAYNIPLDDEEEFSPTDEEFKLIDLYDLTFGQLKWRRYKVLALRNTRREGTSEEGEFPQEYPINAQEAFLTTGVGFFNNSFIDTELAPIAASSEKLKIEVPRKYNSIWQESKRSNVSLTIYELPQQGHRYVITADPSEGLNQDGQSDSCSTDILDSETMNQVATLYGKWEPQVYAELLNDLGLWYNTGLIAVERNNHGHSVLNTLINVLEYPHVYYGTEYDVKNKKQTKKPGHHTNVKSKIMALDSLNELAMDGSLIIRSNRTLTQMKNYSRLPGNKFGASIGHDDAVMSLAIGCSVLKDARALKAFKENRKNTARPVMFKYKGSVAFQ